MILTGLVEHDLIFICTGTPGEALLREVFYRFDAAITAASRSTAIDPGWLRLAARPDGRWPNSLVEDANGSPVVGTFTERFA